MQTTVKVQQQGATLVFTLLLLTALTLASVSTLRNIATGLQLSNSMRSAHGAFALGDAAVADALRWADAHPDRLPVNAAHTLPDAPTTTGRATVTVRHLGTTACSAPYPGERDNYEIRVIATAGRGARSDILQAFYICRERCATGPCAESGPQPSGWAVVNPLR